MTAPQLAFAALVGLLILGGVVLFAVGTDGSWAAAWTLLAAGLVGVVTLLGLLVWDYRRRG